MRGRGFVARSSVGLLVFVVATLAAVVAAGAQQAAPWTLSLTVTKTVEGDGLQAFIGAHPLFAFLLEQDIYSVTVTCNASAVVPDAGSANATATGSIDLAGLGSEGSVTVTLGAGKQVTIPITVEDAAGVDVVNCTIAEEPFAIPAVLPGVTCHVSYRPVNATVFTADGQSATLNVVNECVGTELPAGPPPPPPVEIVPEFTG